MCLDYYLCSRTFCLICILQFQQKNRFQKREFLVSRIWHYAYAMWCRTILENVCSCWLWWLCDVNAVIISANVLKWGLWGRVKGWGGWLSGGTYLMTADGSRFLLFLFLYFFAFFFFCLDF